jgi:hypothetical protein
MAAARDSPSRRRRDVRPTTVENEVTTLERGDEFNCAIRWNLDDRLDAHISNAPHINHRFPRGVQSHLERSIICDPHGAWRSTDEKRHTADRC